MDHIRKERMNEECHQSEKQGVMDEAFNISKLK